MQYSSFLFSSASSDMNNLHFGLLLFEFLSPSLAKANRVYLIGVRLVQHTRNVWVFNCKSA